MTQSAATAKETPNVASPCVRLCGLDAETGLCRGCFRTLDEITGWWKGSDEDRLAILAAVERRLQTAR
ncbi:DUF1289 domain-containing protein [Propionivibrio limicola]|uniref:DUF1289 domain-containing protein n=1 Tax=Propionivibrio limicola TaxID=167645 RepID=UPI0012911350|nr:DUF1289 domain-containing protein [Propionivibrio limicola]